MIDGGCVERCNLFLFFFGMPLGATEHVSKKEANGAFGKNSNARFKKFKHSNPNKGTASGITIVDKDEIQKILKDLGLPIKPELDGNTQK